MVVPGTGGILWQTRRSYDDQELIATMRRKPPTLSQGTQDRLIEGLPSEILDQIIRQSDLPDLKNIRLCCKQFSAFAEPELFYRIVLLPHRTSFARLEALSLHRLAVCVKHLAYDPRTLLFDDAFSLWNAGNQENLPNDEETVARFNQVMASFPNLASFTVQEKAGTTPPTMYCQLTRRTGGRLRMQRLRPDDNVAVFLTALAASDHRLQNLQLRSICGHLFDPSAVSLPDELWEVVGRNLRELRVSHLSHIDDSDEAWRRTNSRLMYLAQSCPQADKIEIDGMNGFILKYEEHAKQPLLTSKQMNLPHFQNLTALSISCVTTSIAEWIEFMTSMSPRFRVLHLGDITLKPNVHVHENESDACWVSVLRIFRGALQLEEIKFQGVLRGGRGQSFYPAIDFDPSFGPSVMAEVRSWMMDERDGAFGTSTACETTGLVGRCPLERAAMQHNGQFVPLVSRWRGDSSWVVSWDE